MEARSLNGRRLLRGRHIVVRGETYALLMTARARTNHIRDGGRMRRDLGTGEVVPSLTTSREEVQSRINRFYAESTALQTPIARFWQSLRTMVPSICSTVRPSLCARDHLGVI